ncbi:2-iminoacetate synthase ThiH [Ilyobacter polytropus]|uniref:Tyrosine lyase ThiH n=1 Tax=Ilyobacter polytropus (strain ATCC 51220 / DSM 2926 / LMG 16218 / CuHBu1) TaxID=572544 RepID=E3H8I3_ILYPC|nr:2-iminoacetate synthase ThiH [Ilyobacter polytropus]ADO82965.1 tyrosine lyase ThiH [Ilyobacter polytropus DSM 2926]
MSFYDLMKGWEDFDFEAYFSEVSHEDIIRTLQKDKLEELDLLNLLSPQAQYFLEEIAKKSYAVTRQHFGNIISLYIPLYVSNYCTNHCIYCGFNKENKIIRKHLSLKEVEKELVAISKTGMSHIILLTGEAEGLIDINYLKGIVEKATKYFPSVSIEVLPLETDDYQVLKQSGLDGLTVYQEVYDEDIYDQVHISGGKKNYRFRLDTPERGAKAGLRNINIAPLFGLGEIKKEAFFAGLHLKYLTDKYLNTEFGVSLPRINSAEGGFKAFHKMDDTAFIQVMMAYRLFQPKAGITVSTRESHEFRNNIMPLGVTKFSAGSKTGVGGYAEKDLSTCQFEISDKSSIEETEKAIRERGFQPVYKDWHTI